MGLLPDDMPLSVKLLSGSTRSIEQQVEGNTTGNITMTSLATQATLGKPFWASDFLGWYDAPVYGSIYAEGSYERNLFTNIYYNASSTAFFAADNGGVEIIFTAGDEFKLEHTQLDDIDGVDPITNVQLYDLLKNLVK